MNKQKKLNKTINNTLNKTVDDEGRLRLLAAAQKRLNLIQLKTAFDPADPESRPTAQQLEILQDFGKIPKQWIIAGNQSGKSQTCSRLITWALTETHPYWKRPTDWLDEPLFVLICGRSGKQIEESLLPKIISYLEPGTFKVVRIGNIVQKLQMDNGAKIVFQSLENASVARERIQSYVAHIAWVDEMPSSTAILDELQRRIQARNGLFLASFTPLSINQDIKNMVEAAALPYSKSYKLAMFDNPVYANPERKREIEASMATLPESVRRTRLYGDWGQPETAVYYFDEETMVREPVGYHSGWRHVEWSDPALDSAHGFCVAAEDPRSGLWYLIRCEYIKGIFVPDKLVDAVIFRTKNVHVVQRVADPAATWYIHTANSKGHNYVTPYNKNSRKEELIKGLQAALGTRLFIAPWCKEFIDEITTCHFSENGDNIIVKRSRFHILDCAQYGVDCLPRSTVPTQSVSWETELRIQHATIKKKEEAKTKAISSHGRMRVSGAWGRRW